MTHPDLGGLDDSDIAAEINGNLIALNALAGVPLSSIKGFRAPFLNYSVGVLQALKTAGFTYDSSSTSSIPVNVSGTDANWYVSPHSFLFILDLMAIP
jgi:hypothetical protein